MPHGYPTTPGIGDSPDVKIIPSYPHSDTRIYATRNNNNKLYSKNVIACITHQNHPLPVEQLDTYLPKHSCVHYVTSHAPLEVQSGIDIIYCTRSSDSPRHTPSSSKISIYTAPTLAIHMDYLRQSPAPTVHYPGPLVSRTQRGETSTIQEIYSQKNNITY